MGHRQGRPVMAGQEAIGHRRRHHLQGVPEQLLTEDPERGLQGLRHQRGDPQGPAEDTEPACC